MICRKKITLFTLCITSYFGFSVEVIDFKNLKPNLEKFEDSIEVAPEKIRSFQFSGNKIFDHLGYKSLI